MRAGGPRIARPVLRLATRLNRRTRLTVWAIAFACMVLVGSLSLVDGMSAGVDSVAARFQVGPFVYLQGSDLLASSIAAASLASIPGNYSVLRVLMGTASVNGASQPVVIASLEVHAGGVTTVPFPANASQVAVDRGLLAILTNANAPAPTTVNLTVSGRTVPDLPAAPPPDARPVLFPDTWAWVDLSVLEALDSAAGTRVQAVLTGTPLPSSTTSALGMAPLDTLGAVAFVQSSVTDARAALETLSVVIGAVIGLLMLSAMSLDVLQREAELRTLRGLGASPRAVAAIIGGRAAFLAVLGATLGSTLGIAVAHAIVSFAPVFGYPSLIVLAPPYVAVLLVFAASVGASLLGALGPALRAAAVVREAKGAVPS